jgi:hypothetical protein
MGEFGFMNRIRKWFTSADPARGKPLPNIIWLPSMMDVSDGKDFSPLHLGSEHF